jgi:uncharacterized protein
MDLPADTVYEITKTFWQNLEKAQKTAPFVKKVTLDIALSSDIMKLHPGALRYYKEIKATISPKME